MRNASTPCPFCLRIENNDYRFVSGSLYHEEDGSGGVDDPDVVSFIPPNPVTPGHRLFVPVAHIARPWEMGSCAYGDIWTGAVRYGEHGIRVGWWTGFNLITSYGASATQTTEHVHIHCVPRRLEDELKLPWSPGSYTD